MVASSIVVTSFDDVRRALDAGVEQVEMEIDADVPAWLTDAVAAAHAAGALWRVRVDPPATLAGEALAGWEIGVTASLLRAGVDEVAGIEERRLARVRAVLDRLGS